MAVLLNIGILIILSGWFNNDNNKLSNNVGLAALWKRIFLTAEAILEINLVPQKKSEHYVLFIAY